MVFDGQITRPDHVPYKKYQELLEETNSLKMQALYREKEVETLKGMLAQKEKDMVRLKDRLHRRDATISKLRAVVEFAWTEFDSATKSLQGFYTIEKHENDSTQKIDGTTSTVNEIGITNQDGNTAILGEPPPLLSTFKRPPTPTQPTEAKISKEVPKPLMKEAKQEDRLPASSPTIVFTSKGRPPPPPPPPPRPRPPIPPTEANIVGATPTPVRKFIISPPTQIEANITGATQTPVSRSFGDPSSHLQKNTSQT
ncbi:unnamed protein product [Dovyalis caffra]|uniref:Uncharacterized protein n=1 Tax=Dovyalis caffra TaxID=77055 RepID=A0AAV1QVC5_9ROSI|nr:unnamed protein product [Dovyalis caffra]